MQKMVSAKHIEMHPIDSHSANAFIKRHHYSGKVVPNSQLHFGAFLDGKLHGVMSFGPSMDKRKVQGLVEGTGWNEFIELNRMAFDEHLPKNSESRCIAVAMKLLKKHAKHIKWVISFADGTQCGDGTIYRASGFALTGIKTNNTLYLFPTGDKIAGMTIEANWELPIIKKQCEYLGIEHKQRTRNEWKKYGATPLKGYQIRYIYFIDPAYRERLTVPELPYSKIAEMGAAMYLGKPVEDPQQTTKTEV